MITATDEEVLEMMEYLGWRLRGTVDEFKFKASIIEFYDRELGAHTSYASSMADDLWASYRATGMMETFSKYLGDKVASKAMAYAFNKGVN